MPKDEVKHRNGRRNVHFMTQEEAKSGKKSHWEELEITGLYFVDLGSFTSCANLACHAALPHLKVFQHR